MKITHGHRENKNRWWCGVRDGETATLGFGRDVKRLIGRSANENEACSKAQTVLHAVHGSTLSQLPLNSSWTRVAIAVTVAKLNKKDYSWSYFWYSMILIGSNDNITSFNATSWNISIPIALYLRTWDVTLSSSDEAFRFSEVRRMTSGLILLRVKMWILTCCQRYPLENLLLILPGNQNFIFINFYQVVL